MNQNVNRTGILWLNAELKISFIKGKLTVAGMIGKNMKRHINSKQPVLCTRLSLAFGAVLVNLKALLVNYDNNEKYRIKK